MPSKKSLFFILNIAVLATTLVVLLSSSFSTPNVSSLESKSGIVDNISPLDQQIKIGLGLD